GAAVAAAPSSTRPISSLLTMVSPAFLTISLSTPSAGETTSITTLSVSISTSSSSRFTASPACLCHVAIVPSGTDSGKVGALISIVILFPLLGYLGTWAISGCNRQRLFEERAQLFKVQGWISCCWRCRSLAAGIGQIDLRLDLLSNTTHMMLAGIPGALIHRFFLTPHNFGEIRELLQYVAQRIAWER